MIKLHKTTSGCPIVQIYLEVGQYPARFEIMRIKLLFLKTILNEDEDSLIFKFLKLQLEQKAKGDWATTCLSDLKALNIYETLDDIKKMTESQFKRILKKQLHVLALKYLTGKQKSKGKEIIYSELYMSEYLLPNNHLTIDDQRALFAVRNRMVNIPQKDEKKIAFCICNEAENMSHI